MASYGPDGGYNERPGYWAYAKRYTVYYFSGLETVLGTDFDLSNLDGFSLAGNFRVYSCGTAGKTFNYADEGSNIGESPACSGLRADSSSRLLVVSDASTIADYEKKN